MLPLAFILPLWQIFLLLVAVLTMEQFVRVFIPGCCEVGADWSLQGR